jgi:hypothetical protein
MMAERRGNVKGKSEKGKEGKVKRGTRKSEKGGKRRRENEQATPPSSCNK